MDLHVARRLLSRRAGFLVPILVGAVALGLVLWFLWSTAPQKVPDNVADVNAAVEVGGGSLLQVSLDGDAQLATDGGAAVKVNIYFVCNSAADLVIHMTAMDARTIVPADPSTILRKGQPLSNRTIAPSKTGVDVSGGCSGAQRVDEHFLVTFPAGTVSAPLQRGTHAYGLELFATADVTEAPTKYSLAVNPPDQALVDEAYDATDRTLTRATWSAEKPFGQHAYGTYTVPAEVSRALWLDNALLLLIGALVGIGVDAGLRLVSRRRGRPPGGPA